MQIQFLCCDFYLPTQVPTDPHSILVDNLLEITK